MPGLFFYNYQHCNHSSLLRGKTYEGIKNGDLDLFASIHFPLAREDTRDVPFIVQPTEASIHSPLAREDEKHLISPRDFERFNPLPSCEGRQVHRSSRRWSRLLQSTSLLRGKTEKASITLSPYILLQSTSLLRGKTLRFF